MRSREYSQADKFIMQLDRGLAGLLAGNGTAGRENPAGNQPSTPLSPAEKRVSQGLMRVNHAGEVAAQALYQGQAFTARSKSVQESMQQAAAEELDHLNWCKSRLDELQTHTSFLNPLWYLGSFSIGAVAGLVGDKWSLGFVAETEKQVETHLQGHMGRLPDRDEKSRRILEQMREDEAHHARMAIESGAVELPAQVKRLMTLCSRVMTATAYWI